jgi:hypothetical protein
MPFFLHHQHAEECRPRSRPGQVSQAAASRSRVVDLSREGTLWWRVQAESAAAALALLPLFVARRTVPIEVRDVEIP